MPTVYSITMSDSFSMDLARAPEKARKAIIKTTYPMLRETPSTPGGPIKKLNGTKLWRYKLGKDYRIVYSVDETNRDVHLYLLGHRKEVYDRLDGLHQGKVSIQILAEAPELLDQPGETDLTQSIETSQGANSGPSTHVVNHELLATLEIPSRFHSILLGKSAKACFALEGQVPDDLLLKVHYSLKPPPISRVVQEPKRRVDDSSSLEKLTVGKVGPEHLLLKLDDEQESFVSQFRKPHPTGPWLLKGGPGSGKSTIALYCIRELIAQAQQEIFDHPIRILFTTYTNALTSTSRHLLDKISENRGRHEIVIETIDHLARKHAEDRIARYNPIVEEKEKRDFGSRALHSLKSRQPDFSFEEKDLQFLLDECEWHLAGNGFRKVEDYLSSDRSGRGRRLTPAQRRQAWGFYTILCDFLAKENRCLLRHFVANAAERAPAQYDYVFVDEAQDLTPAAIRLALRSCKQSNRIFLTADLNQSIYGSSISWKRIASELRFSGRTRCIRKNYRTTSDIWKALLQLMPDGTVPDQETLEENCAYRGPSPHLRRYANSSEKREVINRFLRDSLNQENVLPSGAAVLCPTNNGARNAAKLIDNDLKPHYMSAQDFDPLLPGVKALTMHAAKGLQFPIVVVMDVHDGMLPRSPPPGLEPGHHIESQRRLFFVAASRAMRHLLVMADGNKPAPFLDGATEDYWHIDDSDDA